MPFNTELAQKGDLPVPDSKKGPWIGFDLGGTKMLSMVFNKDYEIIGRERKKTKSQDGSGVSIERIVKTIKASLDQAGMAGAKPSSIGIGAPGTLDLTQGVVQEAPNLGWQNVPLKKLLEKEFSCPVIISNDVDAGVYGEYRLGAARDARCVLGLFPGTGIGGGLVCNGQLFTGKTSSCLEVGHIPMVVHGIRCGCGRYGCLETVASRLAISAASAMAVFRGEAPNLQKIAGTDITNMRSGALAQSILAGDKAIELIVRQAAQWLGRALGGLINIFAPDIIVLGGGLVEAMPDIYLQEVEKTTIKHVMPSFEHLYKVVVSKLGDDATALGAAAWARNVIEN